ncbi:hypothetical protein HOLleu_39496 [Holothuria leucospilota]|uniref:Ig-like domain-containing protein n=1 Tax=Holothuria leucospilota TaxID=206669 RepID=A0A9Q1BD01_HOLLE|nr:hypothetical protein HOLleu_39496 [Holothuria leucospilota]
MSFCVIVLSFLTVILYPAVAAYGQIYFNSTCFDNGYCYAFEGDTVALTCTIPSEGGPIGIATISPKASGWDYNAVVENGQLQEAKDISNKFLFESSQGDNSLIIRNLTESDSLIYRCWYNFMYWCSTYGQVNSRCLVTVSGTVTLDVRKKSNTSMEIDLCNLIGGMSGVFFIGEDLILECPTANLSVSISNSTRTVNVDYEYQPFDQNSFLLTIKVSEKSNGTTISCMRKPNIDNTDYCRQFPKLLVFNDIKVIATPEEVVVENGGNATIYCHSSPFLEDADTSFEWDFLDNNVTFGAVEESETSTGRQIVIANIDFQNATSSLIVVCRVSARSKKFFANATVTISLGWHLHTEDPTIFPTLSTATDFSTGPLIVSVFGLTVLIISVIFVFVLKHIYQSKRSKSRQKAVHHTYLETQIISKGHSQQPVCAARDIHMNSSTEGEYCYADTQINISVTNENFGTAHYQNVTK